MGGRSTPVDATTRSAGESRWWVLDSQSIWIAGAKALESFVSFKAGVRVYESHSESSHKLPSEALDPFIAAGETFFIIGSRPPLPAHWTVELELPCAQLLAPENLHCMPQPTEEITLLHDSDKAEMYTLINSIQPGYYHPDTPQLGDYCGIRRDGRLIAMAGERMRITGFSELSAICTHPDYIGHGYAQQLIAWLCRRQHAAGITSFLHVSLGNERALRLYIHLGFRHRREIVFTRLRKT